MCNIFFAWVLLSVGYFIGIPASIHSTEFGIITNPHTTIMSIVPGSPAEKAGLQVGDWVIAAETGSATLPPNADATVLQQFIADHQMQSIVLSVERHGQEKTFLATPSSGIVAGERVIGVELEDVGVVQTPLYLAGIAGAVLCWHMTVSTAQGLFSFFVEAFRGMANFSQIAGPIGIATIGASAVAQGVSTALLLTALISINLALINILPIPGLDGGRLALLLIERGRGRALSPVLVSRLTIIGFVLLIGLLVIVSYHDVLHLLNH
jgi:regulator of sigma E protease